jgi:hypothetical protein
MIHIKFTDAKQARDTPIQEDQTKMLYVPYRALLKETNQHNATCFSLR